MDKMIQIVICDEHISTVGSLETIILADLSLRTQINLTSYTAYEELSQELQHGRFFHIIMIDLDMNDGKGLLIVKYLREKLKNINTRVIYISETEHDLTDLLYTSPSGFLVKPFDKTAVVSLIKKLLKQINNENDLYFTYSKQNKSYQVRKDEILYFESDMKKVRIVTDDLVDTFYGSLEETAARIDDKHFIQCHRSYIVNARQIISYDRNHVLVSNGKLLPIGGPRVKRFRKDISALNGIIQSNVHCSKRS